VGVRARALRILRRAAGWLDERLGLRQPLLEAARHPVPLNSASWWYVFGSATLVCFAILLASGVLLAVAYVPAADEAFQSIQHLNHDQPLGWFVRAVHFWASNFMVGLLLVHMAQVFLFGAYKFPRELTWVIGVFLLLCTLANAFTGQILRFDEDAYWGLGIGVAITGRVPLVGPELVHAMLGGPIIGGRTLTRFYALHVFVVPGLLIALILVHLRLVLRIGISEPPAPGEPVDREAYRSRYRERMDREGVPFFPHAAWRDLVFAGIVVLAIAACAALIGPQGPQGPPDPTRIHVAPRPDFFFLWLFALLALLPPYLETAFVLTAPLVAVGSLVALPFVFGGGERSPRRRPAAVLGLVTLAVSFGVLTHLGVDSPWSPVMDAWSSAATPPEYVRGRSPLALQGALLVQEKQCRNCHSLGGVGGRRGPALDGVADRLDADALTRQLLQGGGNMPAYGRHLDPAEVTALVSFLETLRSRSGPAAHPGAVSPETPRDAAPARAS
jgi:ubiquinol-cytochrome c reductase cytochrome b subunit